MRCIQVVEQVLVDTDALVSPLASPQLQVCLSHGWDVYVSAASLIRLGRRSGRVRAKSRTYLHGWLERLITQYPQAVLPLDGETAWLTGELLAACGGSLARAQLAASALLYGLTILTLRPDAYERYGCRTLGSVRQV